MRLLRRVVVTLTEVVAEAILLGCLLGGLLVALNVDHDGPLWGVVMGMIIGLPFLLFQYGYYLTRVLTGIVLRGGSRWRYPAIAATLFAIHATVLVVRWKPGMSDKGKLMRTPFIVVGACIVFICALGGNWLLRKWTQRVSLAGGPHD